MDWLIDYAALWLLIPFVGLDLVMQARRYYRPRWWRVRATAISLLAFVVSVAVTLGWGSLLRDVRLLDGSRLGTIGGAVVGVLLYELVHYAYHRAAHRWDWLWRASHQLHHSAESIDVWGAYYLHPLDAALFTTWASLVFFPLLGLSVEAAIVASLFLSFNSAFQHANIKTPHWLGFIVQRPESHVLHHARQVQQVNYSDLPIWDMIFGTFKNPAAVTEVDAGFYDGASSRVGEMLVGVDVTRPAHAWRRLEGHTPLDGPTPLGMRANAGSNR